MRVGDHTIGEQHFEKYLVSQGITDFDYEKEHGGKIKRPDYLIRLDNKEYIFDVKEFDAPSSVPTGVIAYDPLPSIREKINKASRQFKEFKDKPCCLVLYNNGDPYVHLQDPSDMLGAMYGNPEIAFDFDLEKGYGDFSTAKPIFGDKGKMIRPHWSKPQNTTISAIITLRHVAIGVQRFRKYMRDLSATQKVKLVACLTTEVDFDKNERQLGVMVYENAFARLPFPRNLFCGPYDERYGADGDVVKRVYAGEGIRTYEEIEEELNNSKTSD